MDALTVYGFIAVFVTLALVAFAMWYSHRQTQETLRKLARATLALHGSPDEKALCEAIKSISPRACPLIDYTIETNHDGKPQIGEWRGKGRKPGREELEKILADLTDKLQSSL